jgi:hypothetical protein
MEKSSPISDTKDTEKHKATFEKWVAHMDDFVKELKEQPEYAIHVEKRPETSSQQSLPFRICVKSLKLNPLCHEWMASGQEGSSFIVSTSGEESVDKWDEFLVRELEKFHSEDVNWAKHALASIADVMVNRIIKYHEKAGMNALEKIICVDFKRCVTKEKMDAINLESNGGKFNYYMWPVTQDNPNWGHHLRYFTFFLTRHDKQQ